MIGSEFVRQYAKSGLPAWESAAIALARQDALGASPPNLTPWPWRTLRLTDGQHVAEIKVASDVLAIGPVADHVRLPLTPEAAQSIANLFGYLLSTPWIAYQTWRDADLKLEPIGLPNQGASLTQYADHSARIDAAMGGARASGVGSVSGIKKDVVVSNAMQPGKVVIFGWYRPPPAPDVFDDGRPLEFGGVAVTDRQPIQPKSNVHGDFYVDYSHGVRFVAPTATLDGQPIATVDLYTHPTFAKLVSHEGALRTPRYPARVKPIAAPPRQASIESFPASSNVVARFVPTTPAPTNQYLADYAAEQRRSP